VSAPSADEDGVEVPYTRLSAPVLRRVAEAYVTREGTDYGQVERPLAAKIDAVIRQLERGEATIVYDARSDSINIVPRPPRR
jgi:uncharacterized protein YheU (UPF0270 family)